MSHRTTLKQAHTHTLECIELHFFPRFFCFIPQPAARIRT